MKTRNILCAASFLMIGLCAQPAMGQVRTFQRTKVLVEKHTGQTCSACYADDVLFEKYVNEHAMADNIVAMRHNGYGSGTLLVGFHKQLSSMWRVSAFPNFFVDRKPQSGRQESPASFQFRASAFNNLDLVGNRMAEPTCVSLSLEGSSFDLATKKLHVVVSGEVTQQLPYLKVHAFITQSGVEAYQINAPGNKLVHNDVSRAYLTANLHGDDLIPAANGTYRVTMDADVLNRYGSTNVDDPKNLKLVVFVSSFVDESVDYADFSYSEVHNADAVVLTELPALSPCAMPSIALVDGRIVCSSTTPGATCSYTVAPVKSAAATNSVGIDVEATSFVVTAYSSADGHADSPKVSRTFTLKELIGETGNPNDVDNSGTVDKADIDALVRKLLQQ